jgi:trigger factor
MQVTETLSEGLKRGFTVVVPSAEIEGKRTAKLSEIGRTLKLPGFRPGRVPLPIVRQRFGSAVMAEVLQESVDEATQQVLSDRGLRAAVQPKVDVVNLPQPGAKAETTADLEFKIDVELLPEVTVPDLGALSLTRLTSTPPDEAVDKALGEIAARQRTLEPVEEDRGAEKGEILKADFTGRIDGVAFPGGAGTDTDLEVGGAGFIPGFTEQIEGMKAGETREIQVSFPEDYGAKDLAGKAATFEIVAKSLNKTTPAAIDDALAVKIGFENLDELRGVIRTQMQREYDQMSRMRVKRELLDALSKSADFPVPQTMADAEFNQIWTRVEADLKEGRADEEDKGKDSETLKGEYRAIAERRVRLGLLLSEVGRANGVTVAADEMNRAMRAEAARYQGQEAQVMEFFRKNPQAADSLRGPIFEDKVVDYILDQAKVEDHAVTPEELAAEPSPEPAMDDAAAAPTPAPDA